MKILYDTEHRIVSDTGDTAVSDILYVPHGKVAILSMFGMGSEYELEKDKATGKKVVVTKDCATVEKLTFSHIDDLDIDFDCGDFTNIYSELQLAMNSRSSRKEPVVTCNTSWALNGCANTVAISVPGLYVVELNNPNQFNDIYIEYDLIDVKDSVSIPKSFFLGA